MPAADARPPRRLPSPDDATTVGRPGPRPHLLWSPLDPGGAKRDDDRCLGGRQRLATLPRRAERPQGSSHGDEVGNEIRGQRPGEPPRGLETRRPARPSIAAGRGGRRAQEGPHGNPQAPGEGDEVVERGGQAAGLEPADRRLGDPQGGGDPRLRQARPKSCFSQDVADARRGRSRSPQQELSVHGPRADVVRGTDVRPSVAEQAVESSLIDEAGTPGDGRESPPDPGRPSGGAKLSRRVPGHLVVPPHSSGRAAWTGGTRPTGADITWAP